MSRALLAAGVIVLLLLPGAARSGGLDSNKPGLTAAETFDTLSTERKQELRAQLDSLRKAFRMDTITRPAGNTLIGGTVFRRHGPAGDWEMSKIEPWDGASPVSMDRTYHHTPEQEQAFVIATVKAMTRNVEPAAKRNEIKNGFIGSLQHSAQPYLRHLDSLRMHIDSGHPARDSIFQYRDSVYQYQKRLDTYRDSIYEYLLTVDVDSL